MEIFHGLNPQTGTRTTMSRIGTNNGPKTPHIAQSLDLGGDISTPSPQTSGLPRAVRIASSPTGDRGTEQYVDADAVLALATEVCDQNMQLMSHVETLRARVLELEDENERLRCLDSSVPVGVEKMVDMLQADIAGLQRELALLKVSKRATDADLEGERRKNEILTEMLACKDSG